MASTLGIQRATVVTTQDPAGKGRLRLRIPQLLGDSVTDWVEPSISGGIIPAPGSTVWVMFIGGDVSRPVYISGWAGATLDGPVTINTGDPNDAGLILQGQGYPDQVAPLLQAMYEPGGFVFFELNPNGTAIFGNHNVFDVDAWAHINTSQASGKGLTIRRVAGQTANVFEAQDEFGAPLASVSGSGEFRQNLQQRIYYAGAYGVMLRADASNFYMLLTNNADPFGTWNALRPFMVNLATGRVSMSNGVDVLNGLTSGGQNVVVTNDARVTADQAVGTASIRTLGNGTLQAAAGATVFNHETRIGTLENNGVYNGNLIYNGDLEVWDAGNTQASGWTNFWTAGTPTSVRDTSVFYQGTASWKVTMAAVTTDLQRLGTPEFRVNPGDYVVIRYRTRGDRLTSAHDVQFLTNDASNAPDIFQPGLTAQGSAQMSPLVINTWEEKVVAFTVPATHTRARVYFNVIVNASLSTNFWLDSVSVTVPGPPANLVGAIPWVASNPLNSWVNYGNPYAPAGYKKQGGIVYLRGLLKNGVTTAGTTLLVLPVGSRPATNESRLFATYSAAGLTRIDVNSDGTVQLQAGGSATYTSLDGIQFPADA